MSEFKAGAKDIATAFADIDIDDDQATPRETVSLKYMQQLVCLVVVSSSRVKGR